MSKYVDRLVKCGYTHTAASQLCCDFIRNLSLFELDCFVVYLESMKDVETV